MSFRYAATAGLPRTTLLLSARLTRGRTSSSAGQFAISTIRLAYARLNVIWEVNKWIKQESVRPRWPYDMRPSVRAEKYIRDASGWRKYVTDGNDNGTDGQTDRQSATQYAAPPREEGRIKMYISCPKKWLHWIRCWELWQITVYCYIVSQRLILVNFCTNENFISMQSRFLSFKSLNTENL